MTPPPRPSGIWTALWLSWGAFLVVGFLVADTVDGLAWPIYWGTAFVMFWAIEGPALAGPIPGATLTEHLQYLVGVCRFPQLGFAAWGLVVVLLGLQAAKLVSWGAEPLWAWLAAILAAAWTFKHFLWTDSRVWRWRDWVRSRRDP